MAVCLWSEAQKASEALEQALEWSSGSWPASHAVYKPHSESYFRSKQMCACFSQVESSLHTALLVVPLSLQLATGLIFPVLVPRVGAPVCGSNHSLPGRISFPYNFHFPLSLLPGAQVWSLLFPSYLILCGSFLQSWLYSSLSTNLQLVFSENCPTYRCIFDVFVGEVRILHRHLLSTWACSQSPFIDISLWCIFSDLQYVFKLFFFDIKLEEFFIYSVQDFV